MKLIVANWKANKTIQESLSWVKEFLALIHNNQVIEKALTEDRVRVIIAPPYPFILPVREAIAGQKNIVIAAQNISHFPAGSYTGEVAARTLGGLVEYALIGHSERRVHLHETLQHVEDKITYANENSIEPILCLRDRSEYTGQNVRIVSFEKFEAIGSGKNVALDTVLAVKRGLGLPHGMKFLYGASVDRHNAPVYLRCPDIDGVLVGTAAQNPRDFFGILMAI